MAQDKDKHFVYEEDLAKVQNTSDYQSFRLSDGLYSNYYVFLNLFFK